VRDVGDADDYASGIQPLALRIPRKPWSLASAHSGRRHGTQIFKSGFALLSPEQASSFRVLNQEAFMEEMMGRGILLWLLGVPIPVIILLWLFLGH
jgi:hypothetical protein